MKESPYKRAAHFTLPTCPACGSIELRTHRSEKDESGVIRWCECRACGVKFHAVGEYESRQFLPRRGNAPAGRP